MRILNYYNSLQPAGFWTIIPLEGSFQTYLVDLLANSGFCQHCMSNTFIYHNYLPLLSPSITWCVINRC